MPNLVLTYRCNSDCQFCFARGQNQETDLTIEKANRLLPFIQSFGRSEVNLLGGEPTLNPDFLSILKLLLVEGFKVRVFTNGKLHKSLIEQLQSIDGEFSFCVNRTDYQLTPEIIQLYRKLGYLTQLAVTIFKPHQNIDHLLDEILTYKLNRQYRLGVAMPIWPKRQNRYLPPNLYQTVANELFPFIQKGVQRDIQAGFDCGFPSCFYNADQKQYFKNNNIQYNSRCGAIPDISSDFIAIPCFPLAQFRESIFERPTWQELQPRLEGHFKHQRIEPLWEKCSDCEELPLGRCCGGCVALRLKE
jgi:MoaA/NifB/PqqE/SkfB family radical SAM enzyme